MQLQQSVAGRTASVSRHPTSRCLRLTVMPSDTTQAHTPAHALPAAARGGGGCQPGTSSGSNCPIITSSSRRSLLLQGSLAAGVLWLSSAAPGAWADEGADLERQLPGLLPLEGSQPGGATAAPQLPKAYQRTMRKLAKALQDSIEAEAAGAKEFEVRRKADGAKDLVKEFVGKWQDNAAVVGDVTHAEMKGAISELGRFYQAAGPRARLDTPTQRRVLDHLAAVQAALPEEEGSLLGF